MAIKDGIIITFRKNTANLTANGARVTSITASKVGTKIVANAEMELAGAREVFAFDTTKPGLLKKSEMFIAYKDSTGSKELDITTSKTKLLFSYSGGKKKGSDIKVTGSNSILGFAFTKVGPGSGGDGILKKKKKR